MIYKILEQIHFMEVGFGEASYKMGNGGVFKYKEKIVWREKLQNISSIKEENGVVIKAMVKDIKLELLLRYENKKLTVEFTNGNPRINRVWLRIPSNNEEKIYGCGESFTHFNLKGNKVRIWVAEHQNLNRMIKKFLGRKILRRGDNHIGNFEKYDSYYVQPTFVSSQKYFLHVDTNCYCEFDFRKDDYTTLMIREIPKAIVIGEGDTFEELLQNLSSVLGRQPKMPEWIYNGTILGVQGGKDVLLQKINSAKNAGVKISGVWCQDWEGVRITAFGKQLMWNWEYDNNLYPNLEETIKELEKENIKFLGYINPFLAVEGDLYKEASEAGYVVKNTKGENYMVTITTFPAAMVDLTNPAAVEWIKNIIKNNMIKVGLKGWMADFGEYMPTDAVVYSGEKGDEIHNSWPALWAKINREAIEEENMLGEIFFFTRAGYTDTIRYSTMMWNGDQHVNFSYDDGLASVIPATLSLGMSGYGLVHSDIGGYTTMLDMKRSKDLFIRWTELCAFSPLMRGHEGNRPDDNIQFDADKDSLYYYSKMSNVYSSLSPYIKALVEENALKGIPVMRPLFMYYDEDRAFDEKYQYLLGRDMLVAPVIDKNENSKMVYLPDDNWIHLWSGKEYKGGSYNISAPYGEPPVFYRKDSKFKDLFNSLRE